MRRMSKHHIRPRSRGGKGVVLIPSSFHEAWHELFDNMTNSEINIFVEKLTTMMPKRKEIDYKEIYNLRKKIKGDVK